MWFKKTEQLLWFTSQFQLLHDAGLGFMASLVTLEQSCADQTFKPKIKAMMRVIERGQSFSQALAQYPDIFEEFYIEMIKVGEHTGKLGEILQELKIYYTRKALFQREVQGALTYPCVIMSLMLLLTAGLCFMVIPKFAAIFASFHAPLPLLTLVLFATVNFIAAHFILISLGLALLIAWVWKYAWPHVSKIKQQERILKLPVLGALYQRILLLQMCRVLGIALKAGLSLQDAVMLLQKMFRSTPFATVIMLILYDLKQGRCLTEIFARPHYFPPILQGFLRIAEETGTLDVQFLALAKIFEAQIEESLERLKALLEPAMMLITGAIVGSVTLAIYYPIFSLGTVI